MILDPKTHFWIKTLALYGQQNLPIWIKSKKMLVKLIPMLESSKRRRRSKYPCSHLKEKSLSYTWKSKILWTCCYAIHLLAEDFLGLKVSKNVSYIPVAKRSSKLQHVKFEGPSVYPEIPWNCQFLVTSRDGVNFEML